jgi:hypothetical protein
MRMRELLRWIPVSLVFFLSLGPRDVLAKGEVTFVVGALSGGDIRVLVEDGFSFPAAYKKSPAFGLRLGSYGFPFAIEGSLLYGPSSLSGTAIRDLAEINTDVLYAEANLLVIVLPGPVSPFLTGGFGIHYLRFDLAQLTTRDSARFGYNFGGGLKLNVERVAIRIDVRDHVTTFALSDVGLGAIASLLGVGEADARVHNVEVSFGVALRF